MEYAVKKDRIYDRGNERLRYRMEYPVFEGHEKINDFYEKIAENCREHCCGALYGEACENGGRYVYEMISKVTHDDGKAVSVLTAARLVEGSGNVREYIKAITWDMNTELMMPPRVVLRRYGGKKQKEFRGKNVFLHKGRVTAIEDIPTLRIFCKGNGVHKKM